MSGSTSGSSRWQSLPPTACACIVAGSAVALSFFSWSLLVAHGFLGNLLVFLGGGLFTVAFMGAVLAAWLWYISEPAPKAAQSHGTATAQQTVAGSGTPHAEDVSQAHGTDALSQQEPHMDAAQKQKLRSMVVQELLHACKVKGPPHSISQHGEYSGWVWSIPESRYDTTEPLPSWPPATEGPAAAAMKWFGGLKAGRLFLARPTTLEDSDVVPVAEVPLSGCTVRLITEGLTGKTRWWRKTPLEISHPTRALLAKQKSFYLFCDGSAAKEQWYTALTWAATDGGGAPKTVQDLYSAFCASLQENKRFTYPQAGGAAESHGSTDTVKEGSQGTKTVQDKKRGLFRRPWGSTQKSSAGKPVKPGKSKLGDGAAAPLAHKPAAFLNPEELDRHWMEAPAPRPTKGKSAKQQLEKQSSLEGARSGASSSHEGLVNHSLETPDDAAAAGAKSKGVQLSSKSGSGRGEPPSSPTTASHSLDSAGRADGEDLAGAVDARSESEASLDSPRSPPKQSDQPGAFGGAEVGAPETVAIEHAVNMLMARVAFDLLRSPRFKQYVMMYVQKKLDDLKAPDYISALQVVDVTFGAGVPHISNLQALASPSAAIWPQALFDLDFTGDVRLVLEAKVDVRDGLAWSSLDKYIKGLEGGGSAPVMPSGLQTHAQNTEAAAAAAAAAGAADSEEEAEQESSSAGSHAGSVPANEAKLSRVSQFLGKLQLRKRVAGGIRQLAEQTAQSISKMQIRLSMDIKALRGPLCVWVPPPPGDRLWFSFLEPPQLQVTASPLVAGRMVKYSYYIARISSFIASKMQSSMSKNMVFPSCGDIKIMQLLALDDEAVASLIPGLTSVLPTAAVPLLVPTVTEGTKAAPASTTTGPKQSEAGSTTVLATPTPPTAASALAQALKTQTDVPPPNLPHSTAQALSQTPTGAQPSVQDTGANAKQQAHQAAAPSKVVTGPSGATVKATGADPNDPALHGLPDQASAKQPIYGTSPHAGSFSSRFGSPKGTSYPSNSSSLVSSPQAPPALQEDMFTRAIHPTKDKRDPVEAEGVELGTINSSGSIGLGDEGLGQALQSLSQEPQAGTEGVTSSSGRAGPAQTQPQTQSQPVSFQSLSALASQASKRWNKATTDVPAGDNAAAGASSSQHTPSVIENAPPTPYAAGADQPSSSHPVAAMPGSNAADTWKGGTQVQPGGNMPASTQTADAPRGDPQLQAASHHPPTSSADVDANDAARVSFIGNAVVDADASVSASYGDGKSQQPAAVGLGKTASMEKKWGYPVPTGSSMFERVRSRHYSQDEEAAAAPAGSSFAHDAVQPAPAFGQKPTGDAGPEEADAGQQGVLDRPTYPELPPTNQRGAHGQGDILQQEAQPSAATGSNSAEAPVLAKLQTSVQPAKEEQGSQSATDSMQGTPRGAPRRSASQNDASGYAVSPKSWIQQQLKGNPALANKWEAKREDVQQRGKKFASNVFSTFTRAEEKWRQSLQHPKDPMPK